MRQHLSNLVAAALVLTTMTGAVAQTSPQAANGPSSTVLTPKAQYDASVKRAKTRLEGDQKICNAETESATRMQCKRDAQSEYDKAVAAAKAEMTAAGQPVAAAPACVDCGKVVSVKQVEKKGEGSAVGLIGGGVVGGVLGHQIGGGTGKTLGPIDFGSNTGDYYRQSIQRPFFACHLRGATDGCTPA